jgi:16S rRNA (guanine966-N2)-methyltransferase
MKIISGRLKNRLIPSLKNATYRPSTGKFKESVFSILKSMEDDIFDGKSVLDLFAGTGSLAFESLSRGAAHITLVDIEPEHIRVCKEFVEKIGEVDNATFLRLDATNLPLSRVQYDIVFMDPPYEKALCSRTLKSLDEKGWLKEGSILALELGRKEDLVLPARYQMISQRVVGAAKLVILSYNEIAKNIIALDLEIQIPSKEK